MIRYFLSIPVLSTLLIAFALVITFSWPKDLSTDAIAYHYYSGSQLFENRLDKDYFAASAQGYFNPLVHAPFAAMVKANWPDRMIGAVLAIYSALSLIILLLLYQQVLGLKQLDLLLVLLLSIETGVALCCIGSSMPDLFLQIPVLGAIFFLFKARQTGLVRWLAISGALWGIALGLKLSAVIYGPAVLLLLCYWCARKYFSWAALLVAMLGVLAGFIFIYGWWGIQLYRKFGNPFFPFFNNWFLSPDYTLQSVQDMRFLSWDFFRQLLLPFRMVSSEPFTYVEIISPDLRAAVFVLLLVAAIMVKVYKKTKLQLTYIEYEFVIFLFVSLYAWIFISGNGRYAIGILLMLGAGVFLLLKSFLRRAQAYQLFAIVLLLQSAIIFFNGFQGGGFRFGDGKWGGTWYDSEFDYRFGDELVLMAGGPFSLIVKSAGAGTSFIATSSSYPLTLNTAIEKKIKQYEHNVIGLISSHGDENIGDDVLASWLFQNFSRFGLSYDKTRGCTRIHGVARDGITKYKLLACHLKIDPSARVAYLERTAIARPYLSEIENRCPNIFAPTDGPVEIIGDSLRKLYRGSEIEVRIYSNKNVVAHKFWSLAYFEIGSWESFVGMTDHEWREKYCVPLIRSRLFPQA